ncbi:unnamed protein product [Gongylonema pulchrum]|uniref:Protein MOR1 n=1 Tax=Gongylonema pulchrum TaxID=637853 RepID=A0A183EEG7_9BILA|nr:unnamed protein product [Gongylonema pulchrum]
MSFLKQKDLTSHRKAQSGKHYKEDDDIQRAPVALATVKLLQKMPQTIVDQNLQGVVVKMCSLLMSRAISVREVAGKTLIEIARTLGPKYICFIVREMKQNMRKGYQICNMDVFGDIADEKSISGITKDVPEAKTHRAYETYRLLGRYVSVQFSDNILSSLKEVSLIFSCSIFPPANFLRRPLYGFLVSSSQCCYGCTRHEVTFKIFPTGVFIPRTRWQL